MTEQAHETVGNGANPKSTTVLPQLDARTASYLGELAADIVAHGGFGEKDPIAAMAAAHTRRQAFAVEMINGESERSQMARKVLCADVYGEAVLRGVRQKALDRCEDIHRGFVMDFVRGVAA